MTSQWTDIQQMPVIDITLYDPNDIYDMYDPAFTWDPTVEDFGRLYRKIKSRGGTIYGIIVDIFTGKNGKIIARVRLTEQGLKRIRRGATISITPPPDSRAASRAEARARCCDNHPPLY